MPYKDKNKGKFNNQRKQARNRGIEFLFSFEEWMKIWIESGFWHERGCHKGQYVMARNGDKGPYAPWNIEIITSEENQYRKSLSLEARAKISKAQFGRKASDETKRKMSITRLGKPRSASTKEKISTSKRGWVPSPETRERMRMGALRRYKLNRES